MNQLPPSIKLNVLKGMSRKLNFDTPKETDPVTARLQRKVNPDYLPKRQFDLTKKLY